MKDYIIGCILCLIANLLQVIFLKFKKKDNFFFFILNYYYYFFTLIKLFIYIKYNKVFWSSIT